MTIQEILEKLNSIKTRMIQNLPSEDRQAYSELYKLFRSIAAMDKRPDCIDLHNMHEGIKAWDNKSSEKTFYLVEYQIGLIEKELEKPETKEEKKND